MRQVYFYLTGPNRGKSMIIMSRYKFVRGVMAVELHTADSVDHHKINSLLGRYHGCIMSDLAPEDFVFPEDKVKAEAVAKAKAEAEARKEQAVPASSDKK
jgi:hypothetical protein